MTDSIYVVFPKSEYDQDLENDENRSKRHKGKHNRYIVNNRRYNLHAINRDNTEIIQCVHAYCSGSGKLSADKKVFTAIRQHCKTCMPDPYAVEREKFREEFVEKLCVNITDTGKAIFNGILDSGRYPKDMKLEYTDKLKKLAQRIRRKVNPTLPRSVKDMYEKLLTEKGKTLLNYDDEKTEHMSAHLIENLCEEEETPSYSLLFADREFIINVLKMVEDLTLEGFCDSTFKPVPKTVMTNKIKGHQLLIFQVNRRNHAIILFYALMERKRIDDYRKLFEYVFDTLVPELKPKLKKVHMDFEIAEATALKAVIDHISIVPCLFHFCQAQWRNASKKNALIKKTKFGKKIELTEEQKRISKEIDELLRLIGKIPFLSPVDIDESLLDFLVGALSTEAQEKVVTYIDYFKKQWLTTCGPTNWTIEGEAHRTNNFAESRNRDINSLFDKNPMPWTFIRDLVKMQKTVIREYFNLCMPKCYDREREKNIKKLCDDYKLGQVPRIDLLVGLVELDRKEDTRDIEEFLVAVEHEEREEEVNEEATRESQARNQSERNKVLKERNEVECEVDEQEAQYSENAGDKSDATLSDLRQYFSTFQP